MSASNLITPTTPTTPQPSSYWRVSTHTNDLYSLSFLWLEITRKCNLTCVHCYADSSPQLPLLEGMTFEDWEAVIVEAAQLGCRRVQFIGGEPTLHPRLPDLIRVASEQGFEFIEVFTNVSCMSDQLIDHFKEHHVSIATSFYSSKPDAHDLITRRKESFSRTVEGIKRIIAAGLNLRVGIILMPANSDQLEPATDLLRSLGVRSIDSDRLRGVGRGAQTESEGENLEELCGECWKGKLCVTATGDTYPCTFSRRTCIGNAKSGLTQLLHTEALYTFRTGVKELESLRLEVNGQSNPTRNPGTAPRPCSPPGKPCAPGRPCLPLQT